LELTDCFKESGYSYKESRDCFKESEYSYKEFRDFMEEFNACFKEFRDFMAEFMDLLVKSAECLAFLNRGFLVYGGF
jgi:hypothetical protein